jgi:hypothetical protein
MQERRSVTSPAGRIESECCTESIRRGSIRRWTEMIVEDNPKIETQRGEVPQQKNRQATNVKQLGDREIASETKQQITHRERGKQK